MSTTKNVRDIISVVENMYESVNSPSASPCEDDMASDRCELSSNDGRFLGNDVKNVKHSNFKLSDIVLSAVANNDKAKLEDSSIPEPPRRLKTRQNKSNGKYTSRNNKPKVSLSDVDISGDTKENMCLVNSEAQFNTEQKCHSITANTTSSGRPTAMDLAVACNGGKRSMWGELREVVESGVLGIHQIQFIPLYIR